MSAATGQAAANFASRMTAVALVLASSGLWRGFARNATDPSCAAESAATLSTRTSGLPRSSQPNRTASSPRESDMEQVVRALVAPPPYLAGVGFGGALAGGAAEPAAGFGARDWSVVRMAGVMS